MLIFGLASAGLRRLALRKGRELWSGLAVLRSLRGGSRVIGFVLVAVFAQILRNWLLLHAVGVDASFFDAIAVLIAVVTLGQLPVGPSVGRRRRGAHPRQRRCGRHGGRGRAAHRDGHARRALLRRLGGRRPSVGHYAPTPAGESILVVESSSTGRVSRSLRPAVVMSPWEPRGRYA